MRDRDLPRADGGAIMKIGNLEYSCEECGTNLKDKVEIILISTTNIEKGIFGTNNLVGSKYLCKKCRRIVLKRISKALK